MAKRDITALAKLLSDTYGISKADSTNFINSFIDTVNRGLIEDRLVKVKGLGTFKVQRVSARRSVDVNTGESILLDGRDKISFTPENALKEQVNKPFGQFQTTVLADGVDFSAIDKKYNFTEELSDDEIEALSDITETVRQDSMAHEDISSLASPLHENNTQSSQIKTVEAEKQETVSETGISAAGVQDASVNQQTEQTEIQVENKDIDTGEENHSAVVDEINHHDSQEQLEDEETDILSAQRLSEEQNPVTIETEPVSSESADNEEADIVVPAADTEENVEATEDEQSSSKGKRWLWVLFIFLLLAVLLSLAYIKFSPQLYKPAPQTDTLSVKADTLLVAVPAVPTEEEMLEKYNAHPLVQTGAWRIVGIADTIVAVQGQTFRGISKAHLGDGMECYVEAVNNGKNTVEVGDTILIPRLKNKKALKKQ